MVRLKIKSLEDFISGLLLFAVGLAAVITAHGYPLGTPARMGPGMMPLYLGILLLVIGAGVCFQSLSLSREAQLGMEERSPGRIPIEEAGLLLRPLFFIVLGMGTFALMVRPLGLAIATTALVLIVTRAESGFPLRLAVLLALFLSLAAVLIFVVGLGLPFPVWP